MTDLAFPPFRPHPLLKGPHAQTIVPTYLRRYRRTRARAFRVPLDDGDQLVVHEARPDDWQDQGPVALLLHGMGGSHRSPYVARLAEKLSRYGIRTFRMDLRGHGAGKYLAVHPGHAGRSEDVRAVVEQLQRRCPGSRISLVGFSMGGNLVLKFLGEEGPQAPARIRAAVAVAPPIDVARCSRHMLRPECRIYARTFTANLVRHVRQMRSRVPSLRQIELDPPPRNLWQFDDRITAPLSGFRDAAQYYQCASAWHTLSQIQVPTLVISSADDPIIPADIFHGAPFSPATQCYLSERGGHIGFLGVRGVDPDRYWLDWRVLEWIFAHGERSAHFYRQRQAEQPARLPQRVTPESLAGAVIGRGTASE